MDNVAIYGTAGFFCWGYTVYWLVWNKSLGSLQGLVRKVLLAKSIYLTGKCIIGEANVGIMALERIYTSLLLYFFLRVSKGAVLLRNLSNTSAAIVLILVNLVFVLYFFDNLTFGPGLVIVEGLFFLYIVKKTLNTIEIIYLNLRNDSEFLEYLKTHYLFLMLIYVYFIDVLVKICLISFYERFKIANNSVPWTILLSIDEFLTNLSIFFIFQRFRKELYHSPPTFLQAILLDPSPSRSELYVLLVFPSPSENFSIGTLLNL